MLVAPPSIVYVPEIVGFALIIVTIAEPEELAVPTDVVVVNVTVAVPEVLLAS